VFARFDLGNDESVVVDGTDPGTIDSDRGGPEVHIGVTVKNDSCFVRSHRLCGKGSVIKVSARRGATRKEVQNCCYRQKRCHGCVEAHLLCSSSKGRELATGK
jgi:hypothetical protein